MKLIEEKTLSSGKVQSECSFSNCLLTLTTQQSPHSLVCCSYIQMQLFPSPGERNSVLLTCLFLSLMLFMFRFPAAILPNSFTRWKGKGPSQREQAFSFSFPCLKGNFQRALVYYLIFTLSCFFITSAAEHILSQRNSPPLAVQSELGTEHRGKSCESTLSAL